MKNNIFFISSLFGITIATAQTPTAGELIKVHSVADATEMNSITGIVPGSLIYNTTNNKMYTYSSGTWEITGNSPKFLDVYDNTASFTIPSTYIQIPLTTTRINEGGIFTVASNQITVGETGVYEVEYGVACRSNTWSNVEVVLRRNGVDVPASFVSGGPYSKYSTTTRKVYLSISNGDALSLFAHNRGSSSIVSDQNGSFVLIKKIK